MTFGENPRFLILFASCIIYLRLLHRPKRKMRQKIIIFSDVKAPKRLVST